MPDRNVEISVLCVPGEDLKPEDNYYLNGRSREWLDPSVITVIEKSNIPDGIYSTFSGMDKKGFSSNASAKSPAVKFKDVRLKLDFAGNFSEQCRIIRDEIASLNKEVNETENGINFYSVTDNPDKPAAGKLPTGSVEEGRSLACVYISDGQVVVTVTGNAKVFRFYKGYIELISSKGNVSNEEFGKDIPKDTGNITSDSNGSADSIFQSKSGKVKDGEIYIMCAGALAEHLTKEALAEILNTTHNRNTVTGEILKPILRGEEKRDLSVMMVDFGTGVEQAEQLTKYGDDYDVSSGIKVSGILAVIFACLACLLLGLYVGKTVLSVANFGVSSDEVYEDTTVVESTAPKKENKNKRKNEGYTYRQEEEESIPQVNSDTETASPEEEAANSTPVPTAKKKEAQKKYIVKQGDTFSSISQKVYGNPNEYQKIMDANPNVDATALIPGMKIKIPKK